MLLIFEVKTDIKSTTAKITDYLKKKKDKIYKWIKKNYKYLFPILFFLIT